MDIEEKNLHLLTHSERRVTEGWQKLRNVEEFADVTLISREGIKFKAHKVILSSLSVEFKTMLKNEDHQKHALLYLCGVNYSQIIYLLDFIYNGQVSVNNDELDTFLSLANDLKIKGLNENNVKQYRNNSNTPVESMNVLNTKKKRRESIINHKSIEMIESVAESNETNHDCDQQGLDPLNLIKDEIAPIEYDVQIKTEKLLNACDKCSYQTKIKSHLNVHIKSIHEGVRYPCDKCIYRATTQSGLRQHMEAIHKGIKYGCKECDFQTGNKLYLVEHTARRHDQTVYSCSRCTENITGKYKFDQHMKSETSHKNTEMIKSANEHIQNNIDTNVDASPKSIGGQMNQDQQKIKNEIAPYHGNKFNNCDRCSFQTNVKSNLNVHIKSVHEGVRYPCQECPYQATTQGGLKHHTKVIHKGIKHGCKECDFETGYKSYLVEHTARMHDQTVYSCSRCKENITGKYMFDQHMKSDANHKNTEMIKSANEHIHNNIDTNVDAPPKSAEVELNQDQQKIKHEIQT